MRALNMAVVCGLSIACLFGGPAFACTSLCFETPDGPIFGANCDLLIQGDGMVFVNPRGVAKTSFRENPEGEPAKWVSKYGSVTFNLAGRELAWGGMNEAGLVISTMELKASKLAKPDARPPLGSGDWVQYVLDTCGSVEDVIAVNERVRLIDDADSPGHFLVADATGNCAGIEHMDHEYLVYTGESLPVRAMSNMPYARALQAYERGGPRWWWSNPGHSAQRFAGAADRNASYDPARHPRPIRYAFGTLTEVVAAGHTKWNIVFDVAAREIWFRSAASPTIKSLSLDAFDFACESPPLMMNINAAAEGDVEGRFSPYDPDVNLAVFRTFCARWGIKVSEEAARGLIDFFEGYDCAPEVSP